MIATLKSKRLRPIQTITLGILALLLLAYIGVLSLASPTLETAGQFWPFSLVGIGGALVANSTGVGGGVVFVPVFALMREAGHLDLSPTAAVGISFAIQCFGMTIGALTWANRFYRRDVKPVEIEHRPIVRKLVLRTLLTGLPALLFTQFVIRVDGDLAFLMFKLFSITLGVLLLVQVFVLRQPHSDRENLAEFDQQAALAIGAVGGMATALFSVGIGELLALTLFLRRYPVDVSVASAVIVSAITVWVGVIFHLQAEHLDWRVLVFAAPAVAVGGFLARRLAHALGATRLKIMTAFWIIGSSSVLLAI
ncbi:sulfite exporter TauE/SafE family protein [Maricaulis sp.]|uniref:sulfite exporter TauE/SafE family protein n=1 Tax=unclassified Maricaulis TaxID=2632371 RepID=UPI001B156B43|nr:sulfite exporter TauE/SafE family protein [Maricaulis sp.]MBO6796808.1 sulfite exporter TauE/SafE family protein [Maricaulis sp.]